MPRLIDLDDPRVCLILCNLEPRWKPMAEINGDDYNELNSVIDALMGCAVDTKESDELEQAFFILEHGSADGLPAYLKAINTIKSEYNRLCKEIDDLKDKIALDEEIAEAFRDKNDFCSRGIRRKNSET